jgi:hypothetical protein
MRAILSHIAFVVNNIEDVLKQKPLQGMEQGCIEAFESEGTRELYLGGQQELGRVLLMQPIAAGPYERALKKRGAGLHHIALDVSSITEFISQISGSGWYIHPSGFQEFPQSKTLFLARPGNPFLVELCERRHANEVKSFVSEMEVTLEKEALVSVLNCARLKPGFLNHLVISNKSYPLRTFF